VTTLEVRKAAIATNVKRLFLIMRDAPTKDTEYHQTD
jgi:hypothetical protein